MFKFLKQKNPEIADLVTKAKFLGKLNQEFLKLVPTPVNQHVQLAHIYGKKLHVIAESPAWAAKFRYMSAHLIPTLNKNIQYFQYVREITISTRPLNQKSQRLNLSRPRNLSSEAKSCLENMAESLGNESKDLKIALLRLAKRHKTSK